MPRPLILATIGQALVDLIVPIDPKSLSATRLLDSVGLRPEPHQHLAPTASSALLNALPQESTRVICGGSALNSLLTFRLSGGDAHAFIRVGDDKFADLFLSDLTTHGVAVTHRRDPSLPTGHSIILSHPQEGRMMTTCLGAAGELLEGDVDAAFGLDATAFLMEGYMLALKSNTPLKLYRERFLSGVTTALSLSAAWIVKQHGESMREALLHSSVVFANAEEAEALTGYSDPAESSLRVCAMMRPSSSATEISQQPIAVVTSGEHGAYICHSDGIVVAEPVHVPAVATTVKDVTGAGDAFAGAFLFLHLSGTDPIHAARGAAALASQVVSEVGARVNPEAAKRWANTWLARASPGLKSNDH